MNRSEADRNVIWRLILGGRSPIRRWFGKRSVSPATVDLTPWVRQLAGLESFGQRQIVLRLPPNCYPTAELMDALADAAASESVIGSPEPTSPRSVEANSAGSAETNATGPRFTGVEWLMDPVSHRRLHVTAVRWGKRTTNAAVASSPPPRIRRSVAMRPSGDVRTLAVASADLAMPPEACCIEIELG